MDTPLRPPPGLHRFKPQCTHITMARVYSWDFHCNSCGHPGPFGWVYRCTQDHEDMIEHAVNSGAKVAFDKLGSFLTSQMGQRKRSAAARVDRLSFLHETTPERLATYRPDQVATILRQRDNLHNAIEKDKMYDAGVIGHFIGADGQVVPVPGPRDETSSWVCKSGNECRYTICPICRPGASDRAYLSLNSVLNGEIPPTAASGFGFHEMGERPVVDANVVKNIGHTEHVPKKRVKYNFNPSAADVMDLLKKQIAECREIDAQAQKSKEEKLKAVDPALVDTSTGDSMLGRLKHSPKCENLALYSDGQGTKTSTSNDSTDLVSFQGPSVRPPWTPPPSPSLYGVTTATESHIVGFAAEKSISDGRSSTSLKTNPGVREGVLTTVPSSTALDRIYQFSNTTPDDYLPYLDEDEYDVGLTLHINKLAYEIATMTELQPPDSAEESYLNEVMTPMEETEEEERRFMPAPLKVNHGVAVMEESVQMHMPDIVNQA